MTRLTIEDVAVLHALLAGRVGDDGMRAVADELGTTPNTLRRALRRAPMQPATVARLQAALAARANDKPRTSLTSEEAGELATLTRMHGAAKLGRLLDVTTSTLIRARSLARLRPATVVRIRNRLDVCMMHTDCLAHPTLGRWCRESMRAEGASAARRGALRDHPNTTTQ